MWGFFLFFFVKSSLFLCGPWTDLRSARYFPWLPALGYGINTVLPAHREAMVGGSPNNTLSSCSQAHHRSRQRHRGRQEPKSQVQRRGHPGWAPLGLSQETSSPVGDQDKAAGSDSPKHFWHGCPRFLGISEASCWGSVPQLHWGCGTSMCQQLGRLGSGGQLLGSLRV